MFIDHAVKLGIAGWRIQVDPGVPGVIFENTGNHLFRLDTIRPDEVDAAISFVFSSDGVTNQDFFTAGLAERRLWLLDEIKKNGDNFPVKSSDELLFSDSSAFYFCRETQTLRVFSPKTQQPFIKLSVPIIYLLTSLGAITDGIFMHGAGAVVDGLAFAILGVPDAGKSTSIAMIQHDFLLSDDMLMMRFKDGKAILHGTPLGPNTDGPGAAPLQAIFFPVKSSSWQLRPLSKFAAIENYYQAQAGYWDKVFKPYRKSHFTKVCQLFSQVKAYEMHFPLGNIDNQAIREALRVSKSD